MTTDEAIEILTDELNTEETLAEPDPQDALRLGIEALKTLQKYRKSHYDARYALLPGETKD